MVSLDHEGTLDCTFLPRAEWTLVSSHGEDSAFTGTFLRQSAAESCRQTFRLTPGSVHDRGAGAVLRIVTTASCKGDNHALADGRYV